MSDELPEKLDASDGNVRSLEPVGTGPEPGAVALAKISESDGGGG